MDTRNKVERVGDFKAVDGGGYKRSMDDQTKPRLDLVPSILMRGVAFVLMHGMKKYAANNWRRGMPRSEVYSAVQRHLTAYNEGEDRDPINKHLPEDKQGSGLSHLWHAACDLAFLMEYEAHPELYAKFDDRFIRPEVPTS